MAAFLRLIALALLLHAGNAAAQDYGWYVALPSQCGPYGEPGAQGMTCRHAEVWGNTPPYVEVTVTYNSENNASACGRQTDSNGAYRCFGFFRRALPECENGGTRDPETLACIPPCSGPGHELGWDGVCGCREGYMPDGTGGCTSSCPDMAGSKYRLTSDQPQGCFRGCVVQLDTVDGFRDCAIRMEMTADGAVSRSCSYTVQNQNCSGGETEGENPEPAPEQEEDKCPTGSSKATINGTSMCLPSSQESEVTNDTTTTTHPDGSTTTKETQIRDKRNEDGTITRETITTTTQRDPNGNTTSTEVEGTSQTASGSAFCEKNRNSNLCGNNQGGVYGASCGQQFTCSGDAVQCGIAWESHLTACALNASDEIIEAFGQAVEGQHNGEGEGLDVKEVPVEELDVSLIGGGGGLSDQVFTIMGKSITLPFSQINPFLDIFGMAVLLIAWIMAFRIIQGAL